MLILVFLLVWVSACHVTRDKADASGLAVQAESPGPVLSETKVPVREPVRARGALIVQLVGEPGVTATELYVQGFDETGMAYARMILDPKSEVLIEDLWPGEYVLEAWNREQLAKQTVTVRQSVATAKVALNTPSDRPQWTESGTIVVVEQGARRMPESGWMEFYADCMVGFVFTRVVNGRWSIATPLPSEVVAVCRMELDGRPAHADPTHFMFSKYWNGTEYAIEARYTPKTVLEVIDRATRQRVPHIDIQALEENEATDTVYHQPHDGRRQRLDEDAFELRANPIELIPWKNEGPFPDWEPIRTWCVRAPGYRWKHVEIDHGVGGRIVVELERETGSR